LSAGGKKYGVSSLKVHRWEKLLPFLTALLLILSFPPFEWSSLAWISLLPLFLYCQKQTDYKKIFFGGFLAGLLFFLHLYAYMALAINFVLPRYLGALVVLGAAVYSAVFYGFFSLLLSFWLKKHRNSLLNSFLASLAVPSFWVLLEHLRSAGFLGHTGGFLGYSQSNGLLLQCISFYGYWGLPFLIVLFQVILFHGKKRWETKNARKTFSLLIIIFAALLAKGVFLPSLFTPEEKEEPLRIALIQGNISQENILNAKMAEDNFIKYLELSRKAHSLYAPLDMIVWPETVFSTSLQRSFPQAEKEIAALAEETGAAILYGAMYEDSFTGKLYNTILLHEKDKIYNSASEKQRSDKIRLVPMAEYFPFPDFLNSLWKIELSLGGYTPGEEPRIFQTKNFKFGGIICFESYFSYPAINIPRGGGEHIFVLTNDAWFLESSGRKQHASVAAIRALETGLGVTQVANTGYTVSYNYRGKEILKLPPSIEGVALLKSTMPRRLTPYCLLGDYFLYLCLAILAASSLQILINRHGSSSATEIDENNLF